MIYGLRKKRRTTRGMACLTFLALALSTTMISSEKVWRRLRARERVNLKSCFLQNRNSLIGGSLSQLETTVVRSKEKLNGIDNLEFYGEEDQYLRTRYQGQYGNAMLPLLELANNYIPMNHTDIVPFQLHVEHEWEIGISNTQHMKPGDEFAYVYNPNFLEPFTLL